MRCEEFSARVNLLLDDRCNPLADQALELHAAECEQCQHVLYYWNKIDDRLISPVISQPKTAPLHSGSPANAATLSHPVSQFDSTENSHSRQRQRAATWLTLAAAACWMSFTFDDGPQHSEPRPPVFATPDPIATAEIANFNLRDIDLQNLDFRIDEPRWWGEVASATLKPVEPLRNSFRPLTNSFQSALQILTPQQASSPSEAMVPDGDFSAQRRQSLYNAV